MNAIFHPIPPLADILGGSLGVAAVVLVVGWTLLAWRRDRDRFDLMRTALEKGITRFPNAPPYWLVSLRQGVTTLAVGIGLLGVGGGAFWLGHGVSMPNGTDLAAPATSQPMDEPPPPPANRTAPDGTASPDNVARRPHPHPPAPNPQLERWHQAQAEGVVGLTSLGIGIIVVVVGIVRIGFARAEQAYAAEQLS